MAPDSSNDSSNGQDTSYPFGTVENGKYVAASDRRLDALERTSSMPATPSQVASDKPINVASASTAMDELEEQGLVELVVPEDEPKGPVYITTVQGQKTLYYLQLEDELDT